jgi:hypothetical protein
MQRTQMKDICCYAPGDLNKIGKEGRTSWDSFSYAILMAHNIWCHIEAVQEGNRKYDGGVVPASLMHDGHDRTFFRDIVDGIFAAKSHAEAMRLVDEHHNWYMDIQGSSANGFHGQKQMNAVTAFNQLFTINETESQDDTEVLDEQALEQLEESEK